MSDKCRECALESALLRLYEAWASLPPTPTCPRPYYAERFRQAIVPGCKHYKGGVQAVKNILAKRDVGAGRLRSYPHLTVEYLVLSGEWDDLFNETDRNLARLRFNNFAAWQRRATGLAVLLSTAWSVLADPLMWEIADSMSL
jgi:hypothetical protein